MTQDESQNVELLEIVLALMGRLKRFILTIGESQGLSLPQVHVIWGLGTGPLSMGTVAEELHCDPSNVTGIVGRLEQMGLVERRADPGDRRVKELVLTDKGERVREEMIQQAGRELPMSRTLTDGEREQLRTLLLKVINQ